jgi:hypothetical protein
MPSIRQSIRSSTASKRPTSAIADGQIALNTASGTPGMFFKDSAGNIIKAGPAHYGASAPNSSPAVGGSTGNSIGEAWLDSSLTPAGWKIWNGSAFVNATPLSSDTVQGLVELATNAETQAGVDTARAVTSASLQSKVSDSISTASASGIASSAAVKTAYDLANAALPKSGGIITGNLEIGSTGSFTFEGSTADGFETTLAVVDPTADRTITFPNITGTVVTTGDTGTVTSTMILDGTILNADVNASAAIAGTKISPDFGAQTIVTTGVHSAAAGSAAAPSITFTSDLNTGFWSPTADTLAASTAGAERLRITAAGLVGIGTSAAYGNSKITIVPATNPTAGDSSDIQLSIGENSANPAYSFKLGYINTGAGWVSSLQSIAGGISANLLLNPSGGNVGIGTTGGPSGRLDVETASDTYVNFSTTNNGSAAGICLIGNNNNEFFGYANNLRFATVTGKNAAGFNERMRMDSSGRLLVGTSTDRFDTKILVESTDGTSGITLARASNDGGPPYSFFIKSRGTAVGSNTVVQSGDTLGFIGFYGTDGTAPVSGASIAALVDGTPGANDMPGRLVFSTTADGAASPTERLRITSAGLVGIGTSSPTTRFHVDFGDAADNSIRLVGDGATNGTALATNWFTGLSYFDVRLGGNTTSETKLRVTSAGLVGIGTTAPGGLLHVGSDGIIITNTLSELAPPTTGNDSYIFRSNNDGSLQFSSRPGAGGKGYRFWRGANITLFNDENGTTTLTSAASTAPFIAKIGSSEVSRIDSSGRLLVGTSSARALYGVTAKFQVEGVDNTSSFSAVRNTNDSGGAYVLLGKSRGTTVNSSTIVQNGDLLGAVFFTGADGSDVNTPAAGIECQVDGIPGTNDMPGRLVFSTTADGASSPTERMWIRKDGYTIHHAPTWVLEVATAAASGTADRLIYGVSERAAAGAGGGNQVFIVYSNGNVVNSNNSYGSVSDIKLKENIVDANSQWDDLKALQVRNYNFKEGQTHTQIGLVAQEAELVSPGLVSESPDRDEDGNDLGTVTKLVNYSVLYMKAVKALQEAIGRIETLEGMVAVNNITIDEQQHQLSTLAARLTALESE